MPQKTNKKNIILGSALHLFSRHGFSGASVRDIAKGAGVSEAALYKHFESKEDMALYMFNEIAALYHKKVVEVVDGEGGAVDKLCGIAEATYSTYRLFPEGIRFILLTEHDFWAKLPPQMRIEHILKDLVEEGMVNGEIFEASPHFHVLTYLGIVLQPLRTYETHKDRLPPFDELCRQVVITLKRTFHKGAEASLEKKSA